MQEGLGISEKAQNGRRHYDFNASLLQIIEADAKPGSENKDLGLDRSLGRKRKKRKERYYLPYLIWEPLNHHGTLSYATVIPTKYFECQKVHLHNCDR